MYYLTCQNIEQRSAIIEKLKNSNILAVFHYLSLHSSPFYAQKHDGRIMPETDRFTDCLLRLPLFYELNEDLVINQLNKTF